MKILICDDMNQDSDRLLGLLKGLGHEPAVFSDGWGVLDYIKSGAAVDLCFFDIMMPSMTGMELARMLRETGYSGSIIFLSSSNEFGPESYGVGAFDYLLKPPTKESVAAVLERFEGVRKNEDMKDVVIKSSGIMKSVLLRDISYVEARRKKTIIRLKAGSEIEAHSTFEEIAGKVLEDARFERCHRSYILNMEDVAQIVGLEVVTRGGEKIPISRSYASVKNRFFAWKFGDDSGPRR